MAIEISQITDQRLRQAAEKSDRYGQNSYNGMLDDMEIDTFIQYAIDYNCSAESILSVTGSDIRDKEISANIDKLKEIDQLEQNLTEKEALLKKENKRLEEICPKYGKMNKIRHNSETIGVIIGIPAGLLLGAKAGCAIGAVGGPVGAAIGTVLGAAAGYFAGRAAGECISKFGLTTEEKQQFEKADEYYRNTVKPIEEECSELRLQIVEKKAELQKI